GFLVRMAATHLATRLATDVGLVRFDCSATRTKQFCRLVGHRVTDTVRHEPRRLVSHTENAVDLVAADALLAGTDQVRLQPPLVQRDLGPLENGAHGHGELRTAVSTEPKTGTVRLAVKAAIALCAATVRAYRARRPAQAFKVLAGGFFVAESGGIEHRSLPRW